MFIWSSMIALWMYILLGLATSVTSTTNNVFTNSFLVKFQGSVENDVAFKIAARNGFENIGEVSNLVKPDDFIRFRAKKNKFVVYKIEFIYNLRHISFKFETIEAYFILNMFLIVENIIDY